MKVNLYVFTPCQHVRGVVVWLHSFLTSTVDGDECSTLRSDRYTSGRDSWYPSNRELVGPQDLSVLCGDDENILFLPAFEHRIIQSLAWSLYFHRSSGSPYRYQRDILWRHVHGYCEDRHVVVRKSFLTIRGRGVETRRNIRDIKILRCHRNIIVCYRTLQWNGDTCASCSGGPGFKLQSANYLSPPMFLVILCLLDRCRIQQRKLFLYAHNT